MTHRRAEWKFETVAGPYKGLIAGLLWCGDALLFSVPFEDRIMRFDPRTREVTEHRRYTSRTMGLARSSEGQLYGCQYGSRRIVRFNDDGSATPMPYRLDGHIHNHPVDLAIDSKGRIWFCDAYGRLAGTTPQLFGPLPHSSVLCLARDDRREWHVTRKTFDTAAPGGIAFSRDERTLYLAENDVSGGARELRAYPVADDGALGAYEVLLAFGADHRGPHRGIEGICVDADGHVLACGGAERSGVGPLLYVFSPDGRLLETHEIPADEPMRCAFGGEGRDILYVAAGGSVFEVRDTGYHG